MDCWFCGSDLIWGSDFDAEDYGYVGQGIVATFTCSGCKSIWEGVQIQEEDEDEEETEE
ncbi:MAG: hypothetical protein ACRC5T_04050 [Cetobacterium sp.]